MSDIDPTIGRKTATDPRQHVRMTTNFFTDGNKFGHVTDARDRAAALCLHGASIGEAKRQGSDGHVLPDALLRDTGLADYPEIAKILIADGVWHPADHDCLRCPQPREDHVYVHDYLEHNRSAAQDAQTIEARRRNGAKGANNRWAGHAPTVKEKRPPGRPRKQLLPEAAVAAVAAVATVHPAEARAAEATAKKVGRPRKAYEPLVHELCNLLATRVRENGYSVGVIGPDSWLKPCELLLRRGWPNSTKPLTEEQVRNAIMWATDDDFWYKNIRSMAKLRKHYERMRDDAKDGTRAKRGQVGAVTRRGAPAAVSVPNMNDLYDDDHLPGGKA